MHAELASGTWRSNLTICMQNQRQVHGEVTLQYTCRISIRYMAK